jgi:membrane-bound lytic murein transglycosylase D
MPDLPVHWNSRLIRYLDFYKNDARGRSIATIWLRRSGRYEASLKKLLRTNNVPEDLFWVSMVESAMNPVAYSPVGAAGLWQFMPETGRQYGLVVDRWIDERLDPERSTIAASKFLQDLYRRFGTWELALAAYNMGYGGLLSAIRKYNTNDFWDLCQYEAGIPWETTLYVPKIISLAILAKNPAAFGLEGVQKDPIVAYDSVNVGPGVALASVAAAAKISLDSVQSLNPQILAARVPPQAKDASGMWAVRVPSGMGAKVNLNILKEKSREPPLERHVVRFGESLQDIAQARGTTMRNLATINALANDEVPRPGTVLLVPIRPSGVPGEDAKTGKSVVVVAYDLPAPAGYRRLFYRVVPGDTLTTIAGAFSVSPDDLRRWNALDPIGRLQEGMSLLVMVPLERDVSNIMARADNDVRVMVVGSDEFFEHFEALKDRVRTTITVGPTDTWQTIARRAGLSVGMLERINRRPRSSKLVNGERLVVYVAANSPMAKQNGSGANHANKKPSTPTATPDALPDEPDSPNDDDKDDEPTSVETPETATIKSP